MCGICGCGEGEMQIDGHAHAHQHGSRDGGSHHRSNPPGRAPRRLDRIEAEILSENDCHATANRQRFHELGVLVLNIVSSPGSGKTTLLAATAAALKNPGILAVIEGDQATDNDAERIREAGVQAVQINTGRGCHLDAHTVGHAVDALSLEGGMVLVIENVGNLVCPAAFDLGEAHKVALLSVTEGEDKPLKYPNMFAAADLLVINKIDLLPYVEFDMTRCIEFALSVNPNIEVIQLSARSGEGLEDWIGWITRAQSKTGCAMHRQPTAQRGGVADSGHLHA